MKFKNIIKLGLIVALLALPTGAASLKAETAAQSGLTSLLTKSNGNSAGKALLSLYTQYKTSGKIDLTNIETISNVITLANNIKGLNGNSSTTSFVKGLISGSKNLVNKNNSTSVLKSLTSIAGLDLSSLGSSASSAIESGAKSLAGNALAGLTGSKTASTAIEAGSDVAQAVSSLTSLFETFKK